jgi:type I restriction enzyme M protein
MTANAFHNITQVEANLCEAADQLRANANLTATEYSIPVLGC